MSVICVKLIEAKEVETFQTGLRAFLRQLEFPPVDMHSVRVELAVIPGQHYAALVSWLDVEDDLMEARPMSQTLGVPQGLMGS